MALEFIHIRLQPDRFSEIKFIAHFLERMKDFVRPCLIGLIRDRRVPQLVVVIHHLKPDSHFPFLLLCLLVSYISSAADTAAFRDSTLPSIGIRT